jgi:hypothetical protein
VLRTLRATLGRRVRILAGVYFAAGVPDGDVTPTVPILRITGSTPPGARLPSGFQGAVVDRVIEIPRRLIR